MNKLNSSSWLILILVGIYGVLPVISININNSKPYTFFLQESDNSLEVGHKSEHRKTEDIRKIGMINPSFGEELYIIEKQSATVHTVSFSPDGKLLASGDEVGVIKLWDMTDFSPMKEIQIFQGHSERIEIIAFSPDGAVLASGGYDYNIKLWNVTELIRGTVTKSQILNEHDIEVIALDFSPDGKVLVSGDVYGNIKIWNMTNQEKNQSIKTIKKAHNAYINCLKFSPNGTLLASCSWDGTIKIWDTTSWSEINLPFKGHTSWVNEIKFSPDGKTLVSASEDYIFWLWDVASGNNTDKLKGHTHISPNFFCYVDFSPSGSIVATGGGDSVIKLWDVTSRKLIRTLSHHDARVRKVVFSPDGTVLVSSSYDNTIKLWNMVHGADIKPPLVGHKGAVNSIGFSPNGTLLASGSDDNTIKLWDVKTRTNFETLAEHNNTVTSVAFSPNGTILASGSMDSTIKLWNMPNKQPIQDLTGHKDFVHSITFSPNGTLLASGSRESNVILWNVNGTILHNCYNHSATVNSVAFSHDGTVVASGSEDKTIVIWDVATGNVKKVLTGHKSAVTSVAFSPISMVLASSSEDTTVKLWNVTNGVELEPQSPLLGHSEAVWSVSFSPDGRIMASGGSDAIRFWNVTTGTEIQTLYSNRAKVTSVDFSPDGMILASVDINSVKLWNLTIIPDFDEDGMNDSWEQQFQPLLDPSDYWDKFDDADNDGLMNGLECFLNTYPNDTDSDNDGMPDGWEYLGGLGVTINDAENDSDNDDMKNLYEYQMGLNPRINDAADDKDGDGLTNLEEFQFGSWANQTDSDLDGMPDSWEHKYSDDNYRFDPRNSSDTWDDPDGDWVNNLNECKGRSDPRNFWSVPLLAPSVSFFIRVTIFLVIVVFGVVIFLNYRNKERKAFTTSLAAPDYITALKIQRAGYSDYQAFLRAEEDGKTLIEIGKKLFFQGEYRRAIQEYEKALSVFERTENDLMVASIVFRVARIQKERQELTGDSFILKLIPQTSIAGSVIEAFDQMLQAMVAETKKNWGTANEHWQAALEYKGLDVEFQIICQGAIVDYEVRNWLDNPLDTTLKPLFIQMKNWREACKINQQFGSLCQAYLLGARVALASFQFEEMEENLDQCEKIAEEKELKKYQELVRKETKIFLEHKKRISSVLESEKPATPEEQIKLLQDYIKTALASLEKGE